MSEIFNGNNRTRDEKLSTADLVNRSRSTAAVQESEISGEDASFPPDRELSDQTPLDSLSIDDRVGGAPDDARDVRAAAVESEPAHSNQLFAQDELNGFRSHWDAVQTSFVDEPRAAVEQADSLVASVVQRIAEQFASERAQLEKQWDRGEAVDTEELRQAFKRYRAFFDRLLAF
jgi:hypothetical protein